MTAITTTGLAVELRQRTEAVERLLGRRELVGSRRWGMAVLYYRAGLSQEEIGEIFGMSRQAVSGQLTRALRVVERAGRETATTQSAD